MKEKMNTEIKPFQLITGSYVVYEGEIQRVVSSSEEGYIISASPIDIERRISRVRLRENVDKFSGVPLTEDILSSIEGMERMPDSFIYRTAPIQYLMLDDPTEDGYRVFIGDEGCNRILFLHELQLIITALTGQQIKLK